MKNYLRDFLSLLFPRCCVCCKTALNIYEEHLCLLCQEDLPRTHFITRPENPVEKVFEGRVDFKSAASWLYFKKGNKTQRLLHDLKYRNNPDLGNYLGQLIGLEVLDCERFKNIDVIVPIPLHLKKLKKRGYNQSMSLAEGISSVIKCEVYDELILKNEDSASQTNKNRLQRWENVADIFQINKLPEKKINHLLLVDDVITTGATIESCANKISLAINSEISILSLAYTD